MTTSIKPKKIRTTAEERQRAIKIQLRRGCKLRPVVLPQKGSLTKNEVDEMASRFSHIPWPEKPNEDQPWHPQVDWARKRWIEIQTISRYWSVAQSTQKAPTTTPGPPVTSVAAELRLAKTVARNQRRLNGCLLRPHVLPQEGVLDQLEVTAKARDYPLLPWPKKPPYSAWHPCVRQARRWWNKTQREFCIRAERLDLEAAKAECDGTVAANVSTSSEVAYPNSRFKTITEDVNGKCPEINRRRQLTGSIDTAISVDDTPLFPPRHQNTLAPVQTYDQIAIQQRPDAEPVVARQFAIVESPISTADTQTPSTKHDRCRLLRAEPTPLQENHTTSNDHKTQLCDDLTILQHDVFPPAQRRVMVKAETNSMDVLDRTADTPVLPGVQSRGHGYPVEQGVGFAPARNRRDTVVLEEGEILETASQTCVQASDAMKSRTQTNSSANHLLRHREDQPHRVVFDRKHAPLSCIGRLGRRAVNPSHRARESSASSPSVIDLSVPDQPMVIAEPVFDRSRPQRMSTKPRYTTHEGRAEAFMRAKAEGLIPNEMTYFDLLQLDKKDDEADFRLLISAKRAWEDAGRPEPLPGREGRSPFLHVWDMIRVPAVIRGPDLKRSTEDVEESIEPQAKRRRIEQKTEKSVSTSINSAMQDNNVKKGSPVISTEAVQGKEQEVSRFLISKQDVKDWIRLMSGKKRG